MHSDTEDIWYVFSDTNLICLSAWVYKKTAKCAVWETYLMQGIQCKRITGVGCETEQFYGPSKIFLVLYFLQWVFALFGTA